MTAAELNQAIDQLAQAHRATSLWYLRADYLPRTDAERLTVLEAIQKHAGLEAFRRAGELKQWLSLRSNGTSAASSPSNESAAERAT